MAVSDLIWILDDGPLDTLAAEVNVQSLDCDFYYIDPPRIEYTESKLKNPRLKTRDKDNEVLDKISRFTGLSQDDIVKLKNKL